MDGKKGEIVEIKWYKDLIDDLKKLAFFGLVKTKHAIGKRILDDSQKFEKRQYGNKSAENLAKELNIKPRELWVCIQFAKKYSEFCDVSHNLTWREITHNLLPKPRAKHLTPEAPEGKYKTIVIDPPWPIEKIERIVAPKQKKDIGYQLMDIEEIKQLPMADLFHEGGCNVFLWTTHKHLPVSFEILATWGVKYICTMVWHKKGGFQPFNLPQYNCEFVLYGHSGPIEFTETKDFMCCFNGKRLGHSVKPSEFFSVIQRVSPKPRLEMFARGSHKGFKGWGLESRD